MARTKNPAPHAARSAADTATVGKVLTRSAGAVANALDKLVSLGVAQMATDKPRTYQLTPAAPVPDAAGDPGVSAEATASSA